MPFIPLPGAMRERALAKLLPQNGLLAVLPDDVRARLLPHLAIADLPAGQQLGQPDGTFARAYFPVTGVVSLIQAAADGAERVSALVGQEGVVGLPRFLSDAAVTRVAVQCAGYGLALGREQLLEEWGRGGAFMRVLMRYSRAIAAQKVVLSACRGQHALDQQLATLLLLSLERLPAQEALLAQETTARVLGVATPQFVAAVERLRAVGAATWRRPGLLAAHDSAALRSLACSCHARIASEYERLLPADGNTLAPVPSTSQAAARRAVSRDAMLARGSGDRPHGG
jgi:CRP-like cAMP-binding protein